MKNVKKFYELAEKKFEIKEDNKDDKTIQEFMEKIRDHFENNIIADKKMRYDKRDVYIKDIISEWEVLIDTYKDSLSLSSFSSLKSELTIAFSLLGSVFIGSQKINYEDKKFEILAKIGVILIAVAFVLFGSVDRIEKYYEKGIVYERRFYSICLKILKEVESNLTEKKVN